ncbi:MAG: hypothetical protein IJB90_04015 [Clostridia bacterium]|nr:hypothetical protein [Clostridia bacterium]
MKDLLKSNIYDVCETIVVMGACVPYMQTKGYEEIKQISENIYELCLEQTHINMAISKIGGMLRTGKIKKIIFVTVDKSPHCVQMHYIRNELEKMMDLKNIIIENYVIVDNELIKIKPEIIAFSKNLKELNSMA